MIDTLGFYVLIDEQTYAFLNTQSIVTERIDKLTGEIIFEYDNFHLNTSHNYKVIFRLDNRVWQYDPASCVPVLVEGLPYLRFEFSAVKLLFGHNLQSCTVSDALYAAMLVREAFNKTFSVNIPSVREWYCYRIDTCANYILSNSEQVKSLIRYLQRLNYPRKVKNNYEDTGMYFATRHNTLKIYHKGAEFKKHDSSRFAMNERLLAELQKQANCIFRIEVEHKGRLKYIADKLIHAGHLFDIFQGYIKIYDLLSKIDVKGEMQRVVNNFLSGTETKVMRSLDVYRLLKATLGSRRANTYYSVYTLLITQGQKEAKRQVGKSTYYRALQKFKELGISIVASDIKKLDMKLSKDFPEDFSFEMSENNKYYQLPTPAPLRHPILAKLAEMAGKEE